MSYDSSQDTKAHIQRVRDLLFGCRLILSNRGEDHDKTKLEEPEKSGFDAATLKLQELTYGSYEYKRALATYLKPALDHHYAHNSHHPEHYPKRPESVISHTLRTVADDLDKREEPNLPDAAAFMRDTADQLEASINGMSLFDVIEMLMDWKAATERMKGGHGDIRQSLLINQDRFKISPQLRNILENTIKETGW